MSFSYLSDIFISQRIYSHPNGIDIVIGLSPLYEFKPVIRLNNSNTDCVVFFSDTEWRCVFDELTSIQSYSVNVTNIYMYKLYRLLYCHKRCSESFIVLILEAINKFVNCIELNVKELLCESYIEAKLFVENIISFCKKFRMVSVYNLKCIIEYCKTKHSVIEEEISVIGISYFHPWLLQTNVHILE